MYVLCVILTARLWVQGECVSKPSVAVALQEVCLCLIKFISASHLLSGEF